jgi:hypothetical protein
MRMHAAQTTELGDLLDDLEGRVAGVLSRFFKNKKKHLKAVTDSREQVTDAEMVELALATNALLFQLATLLVSIQRKTGSDLTDIVKLETKELQRFVTIAKRLHDGPDINDISIN